MTVENNILLIVNISDRHEIFRQHYPNGYHLDFIQRVAADKNIMVEVWDK